MSLMRVDYRCRRSASPEFEGQFFIHARSGYLSGQIGPSSNGRTADFGSVNGGSNPPGPTAPSLCPTIGLDRCFGGRPPIELAGPAKPQLTQPASLFRNGGPLQAGFNFPHI